MEQTNDLKFAAAQKRAKDKIEFIQHLCIYLVINGVLVTVNLATSPNAFWVIFPLAGWGFGLFIHFLSVFIFDGTFKRLEQRFLEAELRKQN